jgi:hypothetical protein
VRLRPVRRLEFRDVADDDEMVPPGGNDRMYNDLLVVEVGGLVRAA